VPAGLSTRFGVPSRGSGWGPKSPGILRWQEFTRDTLQILDTDPEESFNRIVELATHIFHVPIAQVSLVDARREWFKASCGIKEQEGDGRTAFCAHTILDDRVFIIEDTVKDDRFCHNPRVTIQPGIRFYAGAPLQSPSG
jgi:GAF domain-containing protein